MAPKRCPMCGQMSLVKMNGEYRFEPPANIPGGPIVVAEALWMHCGSCGEDILSGELEQSIEDERRRRLGLFTPEEIRKVREKMGLSMQNMSDLIGVGERTYARWENGRSLPTTQGNALLRQMVKSPEMLAIRAAEREASRGHSA